MTVASQTRAAAVGCRGAHCSKLLRNRLETAGAARLASGQRKEVPGQHRGQITG
jgi:hypothetical protein